MWLDASEKPKSRWRTAGQVATVIAGISMLAWLVLRDTSPIGHWTSAGGKDDFMSAYAKAMQALPAPDATLDVRTSYGVVRMYRFDGDGPDTTPLVLLPGRSAASPMWADNVPSLRKLRTVYTIDLLGEPGASIQDRPVVNDDDQARWLHEAFQQLPEPAVHLLGVSIGGWTAMNLAVRQPQKIKSVIVLDPVMTFTNLSAGVIVRSIPVSVKWAPKSWRDSFNSWTANGAPVEDVPVADMIESGMQNYVLKLPAPTRLSSEQLASLQMPVLAIMAGKSVMHDSAAGARTAKETLRQGTVLTYEDASHALNGEYPDRIAADVGTFLNGLER
ncbi:alpha/beta fold hydrolase [Catelliglobosispora koreensis]|uniref:alpha/beta fold hydrolase n=1 Tax=Catelliglobosispora koreensis TaxID=129052 RepID=UPI000371979E|nr:alpha/beta hydrolase [Catelliglobosispora koreensis]